MKRRHNSREESSNVIFVESLETVEQTLQRNAILNKIRGREYAFKNQGNPLSLKQRLHIEMADDDENVRHELNRTNTFEASQLITNEEPNSLSRLSKIMICISCGLILVLLIVFIILRLVNM